VLEECPGSVSRTEDQNLWQTGKKGCREEGYLMRTGGKERGWMLDDGCRV
jgi:hypothetical protein